MVAFVGGPADQSRNKPVAYKRRHFNDKQFKRDDTSVVLFAASFHSLHMYVSHTMEMGTLFELCGLLELTLCAKFNISVKK